MPDRNGSERSHERSPQRRHRYVVGGLGHETQANMCSMSPCDSRYRQSGRREETGEGRVKPERELRARARAKNGRKGV